jgi:hypothetical protein
MNGTLVADKATFLRMPFHTWPHEENAFAWFHDILNKCIGMFEARAFSNVSQFLDLELPENREWFMSIPSSLTRIMLPCLKEELRISLWFWISCHRLRHQWEHEYNLVSNDNGKRQNLPILSLLNERAQFSLFWYMYSFGWKGSPLLKIQTDDDFRVSAEGVFRMGTLYESLEWCVLANSETFGGLSLNIPLILSQKIIDLLSMCDPAEMKRKIRRILQRSVCTPSLYHYLQTLWQWSKSVGCLRSRKGEQTVYDKREITLHDAVKTINITFQTRWQYLPSSVRYKIQHDIIQYTPNDTGARTGEARHDITKMIAELLPDPSIFGTHGNCMQHMSNIWCHHRIRTILSYLSKVTRPHMLETLIHEVQKRMDVSLQAEARQSWREDMKLYRRVFEKR